MKENKAAINFLSHSFMFGYLNKKLASFFILHLSIRMLTKRQTEDNKTNDKTPAIPTTILKRKQN